MKKLILFVVYLTTCSTLLYSQSLPTGIWPDNTGGTSLIGTTSDKAVGIGTTIPKAWLEINYCAPSNIGQIITKKYNCLPPNSDGIQDFGGILSPNYSGILASGTGYEPSTEPLPIQVGFQNFPYSLFNVIDMNLSNVDIFGHHYGNINSPSNSAEVPIFWTRTYNGTQFNSRFIVMPNGSTGINTVSPRATLDVIGNGLGSGHPGAIFGVRALRSAFPAPSSSNSTSSQNLASIYTQHLQIVPRCVVNSFNKITEDKDIGIFFTDGLGTNGANSNGSLVIAPWADDLNGNAVGGVRIDQLGNVHAHGYVKSTEVKINPKWWSDFVFDDNYKLASLDSIEQFLIINNHLPSVPSEKEVLANGINIGEIQAIQLQKIEELTLYLVEINKEIKALKLENANLKKYLLK
jgi:hypothetical protein